MITWPEFEKVEIRAGTVVAAAPFPEARRPALRLEIEFGPPIGRKASSAQITALYEPTDLIGRQVLAVVNLGPKQIGPMMSECLVLGFPSADGSVVLAVPDRPVPDGLRLL